MIEIKGKYNQAKIFTEVVEEGAKDQIKTLCDMAFTQGSRIRVMPDVHEGAGCTIGTTMTIGDKAVPNLVGVDIGCGMETIAIDNKSIELQQLDKLIYEKIPFGKNIRTEAHGYNEEIDLNQLKCENQVNINRGIYSLGTLGGGNHFIEVNRDEEENLYVVVHSGSRNLGLQVANYYQEKGYQQLKKQLGNEIPKQLAYVEGELFQDYIHDMTIIQRFAQLNRMAMMDELIRGMKLKVRDQFTTIHNYIDTKAMILRKGAVSAQEGEQILIPINMRDGSLICRGKGNKDWNYSAPHGAGRLMSRTVAKSSFTLSQFKEQMKGIYSTSVGRDTLDECPMAYKKMEDILENIGPTAELIKIIRPIYNFKAGE